MKINTSRKGSRQMAATKGLLPFIATAAIAGGLDAGFGGGALAQEKNATVIYNNTIYNLKTTTCFAQGAQNNFCNGAIDFRSSSWWGNAQLAKDLSEATKESLGLPNPAMGTGLGANFAWQSGAQYDLPDPSNPSKGIPVPVTNIPFDGFEWDPVLNKAYARGGFWNGVTGDGATRTYTLAVETAPPQPITTVGPILATNNNDPSINSTAGLAAQKVLPQFQGGTLVVSAAASIGDNFTVDDHDTNAIDAEGNSATFMGAFTDQVGQQGNLIFSNSGASSAITTLTGQSSYTGSTTVESGTLAINGSITSKTTVGPRGTLQGTGTITGDVFNEGSVSPGNSIGTLTVDGSYLQGASASLNIEADGSSSDLLKIIGGNRVVLLGGNLNISTYQGAPISANKIYTAIDVAGADAIGGEIGLKTNFPAVGQSGFTFVRETDPLFKQIDPAYYAICTSSDPNIQKNCTKLQFALVPNNPQTSQPLNPTSTKEPGKQAISSVKETGGAITTASSGNPNSNTKTCLSNGGSTSTCQQQNQPGSGAAASNSNTVATAKTLDAGWASVSAAVTTGVTGGKAIGTTGYTTNQTRAALVTPDFANVVAALFAVPTRQQLNQALHSITAEPYASMQSVALEAMEQFRQNSLALSDGDRAIRLFTEAEVCRAEDGSLIPADSSQRPSDCQPRKLSQASRWSLLIDATNTQAGLEGTNDLASLDYNIFQSTYGLQYDASKQWSIGAAFGYGQANLYNYEYANSSISSDTYGGSLWGIYRPSNPWKLTGLIGYTNFQYDSNRNINFGGLDRNATASWSGNGFTTALEAEYDWILSANKADRNAIRLKPNTYVAYSLHSQGDITESGAQSLNLAVDSHTADSLVYGIGFTLETPIQVASSTRLIPRLSVGYEHDFNADTNEEHQLTASFADVPALGSLDVLGQNRGANDLNVALNVELETSDQFSLYAGVGGSFWSNGNELNYGGGLRWRFGGSP